jgi:hypothetical protein
MHAELVLIFCLTLVPCLLLVLLGVYMMGKRRGWQQGRMQIEVISLREGETLYGVIDTGRRHRFVTRIEPSHDKGYE